MQGLNLFAKYNSDAVRIFIEIVQKQPTEVLFCKKVFLEISQNSQENTSARVSFLKLQASGL